MVVCGGGGHREGVLGVMFWLGPHVRMALSFREEGKGIPEWSLPMHWGITTSVPKHP